jgi:hypothetical protein
VLDRRMNLGLFTSTVRAMVITEAMPWPRLRMPCAQLRSEEICHANRHVRSAATKLNRNASPYLRSQIVRRKAGRYGQTQRVEESLRPLSALCCDVHRLTCTDLHHSSKFRWKQRF